MTKLTPCGLARAAHELAGVLAVRNNSIDLARMVVRNQATAVNNNKHARMQRQLLSHRS
jgi:uncharacterized protein YejL (UPF0352 family)